jgi:hypothetical protein
VSKRDFASRYEEITTDEEAKFIESTSEVAAYPGHAHLWERAMSRHQFIKTAAGAAGIFLGAGVFCPTALQAATQAARPRPIPGGVRAFGPRSPFLHIFPPKRGSEASTITNFKGFVGVAVIQGRGTGTNTDTGATTELFYAVHNRFMKGRYVGLDGRRHQGTFGYI